MDILVVDLAAVLDSSKNGSEVRERLFQEFNDAKTHWEGLRAQAKAASSAMQKSLADELTAFEANTLARIEAERQSARATLLEKTRVIIEKLRVERGATYVLDAAAIVLAPEAADITALVVAALDDDA